MDTNEVVSLIFNWVEMREWMEPGRDWSEWEVLNHE